MPQFYPDGPAAVSLNAIQENGGLNMPPQESFDTPALQGTMQQLLSENLGKFVIADFLIGVSLLVRRVGTLYSVGRGYLVLYLDQYKAFEVCDMFSLKFATFFPPGSEPTLEEIANNAYTSGILSPSRIGGVLGADQSISTPGMMSTAGSGSRARAGDANGTAPGMAGMSGAGNSGRNSMSPGCRTLGR